MVSSVFRLLSSATADVSRERSRLDEDRWQPSRRVVVAAAAARRGVHGVARGRGEQERRAEDADARGVKRRRRPRGVVERVGGAEDVKPQLRVRHLEEDGVRERPARRAPHARRRRRSARRRGVVGFVLVVVVVAVRAVAIVAAVAVAAVAVAVAHVQRHDVVAVREEALGCTLHYITLHYLTLHPRRV